MTTANVKGKEGDILTVIRELETKSAPPPGHVKAREEEALPDPLKLRESLLSKRDIFRVLEKVGYVDSGDIKEKLNAAIRDLDEIIKTTS